MTPSLADLKLHGSGSRSASCRPAGSVTPQTEPVATYSFQPEPAR